MKTGFRKTMDYLYDGEPDTMLPLLFIKQNYKQWPAIFNWLVANEKKGKTLIDFFKNESPDGGGFHLGVTHILSRLKGHKHNTVGIKADELSGV